mmetsp:Transcript_32607/g.59964  ORF Transcript_32607/g.59964 Transcript_32607/m.59964 type:complete len:293 (-) Transcript_32607:254-1132(-)
MTSVTSFFSLLTIANGPTHPFLQPSASSSSSSVASLRFVLPFSPNAFPNSLVFTSASVLVVTRNMPCFLSLNSTFLVCVSPSSNGTFATSSSAVTHNVWEYVRWGMPNESSFWTMGFEERSASPPAPAAAPAAGSSFFPPSSFLPPGTFSPSPTAPLTTALSNIVPHHPRHFAPLISAPVFWAAIAKRTAATTSAAVAESPARNGPEPFPDSCFSIVPAKVSTSDLNCGSFARFPNAAPDKSVTAVSTQLSTTAALAPSPHIPASGTIPLIDLATPPKPFTVRSDPLELNGL